ncbi:hypothetical protein [Methylobacterium sp. ID0610]|uniref:hypothetical protein n=1 Tax=Methylobacterium carpenticola TaxID=3344827 RepID=UPI0036CA80EF
MSRKLLIALALFTGGAAPASAQETRVINVWGQEFEVPARGPGGLLAGALGSDTVLTTGTVADTTQSSVRFAPTSLAAKPGNRVLRSTR